MSCSHKHRTASKSDQRNTGRQTFLLLSRQQTISKVFNERTREANNELKFLHCEITKLHRIIRDDDLKQRILLK